jgi:carbon monoxide dehydrogenase subunit G
MSGQLEITSRVLVAAAPERVWQVAMDWSRQHEWIWATQVSGGTGTGAEVAARTGIGPVGFTDTMVITEWDPPRRCVVRHTGRVVRGLGIFEVVPSGQQAEFRWTELLRLPGPLSGRLGRWTIAPIARWGLAGSLRRLARLASR